MSNTEVRVPDLGGAAGVKVIELLVAVGDSVEREQPLVMLESEKATMEVPSSVAGKVVAVHLAPGATVEVGTYRLVFDVKGYFDARGVALPEPRFLDQVTLDFGIAHTDQHYHVPLLVSPWSHSTYRGS